MEKNYIEGILVRKKDDYTSIGMVTLEPNNKWGSYIELPDFIFNKVKDMIDGFKLPDSGTYIKITIECNKTLSNIEIKE